MKLSTKILLLIAPVILISAAASSYIIYSTQKNSFIKRENNVLQLNMEKLAGHFRQSRSFLHSYAYTLTQSDMVKRYFLTEQNLSRDLKLVNNLREAIYFLQDGDESYTGLAILDSNRKLSYYADNSDDSLAQIDENILEFVDQHYQDTLETSSTNYIQNSQGEGMLVHYEMLDNEMASPTTSHQFNDVFFVVASVSLDKFTALRKQIEFDYQTSLFFTPVAVSLENGVTHSIKLAPELYATVDPAQFLLENKLDSIWNKLSLSFALSAFITVVLLLILLSRNVITPITRLDRQLQQVEKNSARTLNA